METRDVIRLLRARWMMIVLLVLVGVAIASAYSITQAPTYSSTSKVFVSTSSAGTAQDLATGNNFTVQRVITYSALVVTPIVLLPVIDDLNLGVSVPNLAGRVSASAPTGTSLIEITVTDLSAARSAEIANSISKSLTTVVQKIETPDTPGAASPVKLTLAQNATTPGGPISPNVPLNIALGFLVGLFLGVGLAVLRQTLDTRIRSERDVEQITDIPVLGRIMFDAKAKERPLIVHVDPKSQRAESFRSLRTNLQFLEIGREDRSFVVTSSIQSEGKSTSAANLAIALADAGSRVLLVDADLRRPKLADYLGIEGAVGLTDVLIGQAELNEVVQPWGAGKLFVLPAGRVPPNPSELLGSAHMIHLIAEFNRAFDVVIFDSPPLLPVTDAAILAKSVGGVLLVVSAGRALKAQLRGAISALEKVDAPISGLVMTMLPTQGPDAYKYDNYGYGYGYSEDVDKAASSPRNAT
jgi:capsular exopolysaccharide synthesis family protein